MLISMVGAIVIPGNRVPIESLTDLANIDVLVALAEAGRPEMLPPVVFNGEPCIYGPPDVLMLSGDTKLSIFELVSPRLAKAWRVVYIQHDFAAKCPEAWKLFPAALEFDAPTGEGEELLGLTTLSQILALVAQETRASFAAES